MHCSHASLQLGNAVSSVRDCMEISDVMKGTKADLILDLRLIKRLYSELSFPFKVQYLLFVIQVKKNMESR